LAWRSEAKEMQGQDVQSIETAKKCEVKQGEGMAPFRNAKNRAEKQRNSKEYIEEI